MNRWAVIFENAMGNQALRNLHKDAHHAYLRQHREVIRLAGATRTGDIGEHSGAIWVIEGTSRTMANELAAGCPFFLYGVHTNYHLLWWGAAPGFEDVKIG